MLVMYRLFTVALVALHLILFYVLAVGTGGILGRQFLRFSHAFKIAYGVAFTGVFISISRGKRAFSRYGKSNFVRNKPPVQLTVGLLLITIFHLCLLSLVVTGFGSSPLARNR